MPLFIRHVQKIDAPPISKFHDFANKRRKNARSKRFRAVSVIIIIIIIFVSKIMKRISYLIKFLKSDACQFFGRCI